MIIRNYTGEDGQSHFEDITLSFEGYGGGRERTLLQSGTGILFAQWPAGFFLEWHNAPRRQYVIILSGQIEIGVGDGTALQLGPGDVALEEDLTGQGHTVRVLGDQPVLFAVVPLAE